MHIPESLLEDTRRFTTKQLWKAKTFYETKKKEYPIDDVEETRHLATLEVLKERGELPDHGSQLARVRNVIQAGLR
jgi:hypothetical protein